jgi:DNA helicase-2/ATP-dependent DNA helicase PcrA
MPSAGAGSPGGAFERLASTAKPKAPAESPFKGAGRKLKPVDNTAPPAPAGNGEVFEGAKVMHDRFGKGTVTKLEGDSPNIKATVFFPAHGNKQLLLKFAKLQVIE